MLANKLMSALSGEAEDKLYVDDVFSAYTYTGNGSTQTINNGIDLAGKGGMVWCKQRSAMQNHVLFDSARGAGSILITDSTGAQNTGYPFSLTSTGFSLGSYSSLPNTSGGSYASWTFRKAPKFFDVVTWTGNDLNPRVMNHSLGASPGMMIVKTTSGAGSTNWNVYHRSLASPKQTLLTLNTSDAASNQGFDYWIDQNESSFIPTSGNNFSGRTYVAYLFAHDTSADGIIQCGSFTTDGAGKCPQVTLGWEPQYVMIKRSSGTGGWMIMDASRGLNVTSTTILQAELADLENYVGSQVYIAPNATGFSGKSQLTGAGETYIYLAIRRPNKPPTTGTEVYNAIARTGTGAAATVTGVGFAPDFISMSGRSYNTYAPVWAWMDRLRGGMQALKTSSNAAEAGNGYVHSFNMDGVTISGALDINNASETYINHFFKRAPGFMDVVCYTANYSGNPQIRHALTVTPELVITKSRTSAVRDWYVAGSILENDWLFLNSNGQKFGSTAYVGSPTYFQAPDINWPDGSPHVAYLFATLPGISKVGSYTGNGTTQTINCGFTTGARFILVKRTDSTGDWYIWDTARGIVSANDPHLSLNTTAAEVTTDDSVDPDVSGFIVNQVAATNINVSGGQYIFLAIA